MDPVPENARENRVRESLVASELQSTRPTRPLNVSPAFLVSPAVNVRPGMPCKPRHSSPSSKSFIQVRQPSPNLYLQPGAVQNEFQIPSIYNIIYMVGGII